MITQKIETNNPLCCPRCSKQLDGATGMVGTTPTAGDLTICLYCSLIMKYTGKGMELKLVRVTAVELRYLKKNEYKVWRTLMDYRALITDLM